MDEDGEAGCAQTGLTAMALSAATQLVLNKRRIINPNQAQSHTIILGLSAGNASQLEVQDESWKNT